MPVRALVLCTGNSARSQMAEGFLRSFDPRIAVFSAGTRPAVEVHPLAIQAMGEKGIDLTPAFPKSVEHFLGQPFDFVFTVCGNAEQDCPPFLGPVSHRIHIGFDDPAAAPSIEEFRRVRDQIQARFFDFYQKEIQHLL